jgi:hypothetical protein
MGFEHLKSTTAEARGGDTPEDQTVNDLLLLK